MTQPTKTWPSELVLWGLLSLFVIGAVKDSQTPGLLVGILVGSQLGYLVKYLVERKAAAPAEVAE